MIDFTLIATGEEFEMFCEDLLRARGLEILSRASRGPDGGRDIIASLAATDPLGFPLDSRILVECKHFAHGGRSVREADVGNIVGRTLTNNCNRYLLITSTIPSVSVARQIEGITANPSIQISAAFWARHDIDRFLHEFPRLYERYFSDDSKQHPKIVEYKHTRRNVIVHSHTDFSQELEGIKVSWNDCQKALFFTTARPSRSLEARLLSSKNPLSETLAAQLAAEIRQEAGFDPKDSIIQFCEMRLYGGPYYQLFAAGTDSDEDPPNTATVSLNMMRSLSAESPQEAQLLKMILNSVLHVIAVDAGLSHHDETRGCIMDFCGNMVDILAAIKDGPKFCHKCSAELERGNGNYVLTLAEATRATLKEQFNAPEVNLRRYLRTERAKEVGENWSYDVALSFAGKDREYARALAEELQRQGVEVFYDGFEKAQLWGSDLYSYLSELYHLRAKYCVIFLSEHYQKSIWANREREAAQARALEENRPYILPIRLDDSQLPHGLSTTGYIIWHTESIDNIAKLIVEKIKNDQDGR